MLDPLDVGGPVDELEEGVGVAVPVALGEGVVESIMSSLDCMLKL